MEENKEKEQDEIIHTKIPTLSNTSLDSVITNLQKRK